jgi:hypothetical protein
MAPDISATVTTGTGNFIGINDGNLTITTGSFNQVGTTAAPLFAQLGPLQNNGGPLAGAPTVALTILTKNPLPGSPVIDMGVNLGSLTATDERGFLRIVNTTVDIGAVEYQPPATLTRVSTSGAVTYGQPLTLTALVTPVLAGNPLTGTVTFSIDGVALATVPLVNGSATQTITPTPTTLKPGNHTLSATYNGAVLFTPSTATQTVVAPNLPALTTTLTRKGGRFTLLVLDDGQPLQKFALRSRPVIQMRALNGGTIPDLVINIRRGKKLVVFAAFSGTTGARIV